LRPRIGEAWGGYVPAVRRFFGYQELVEVVPIRDDVLVVFAAGEVHRIDLRNGQCERTHRLRYFGRRTGRGVFPFGITSTPDGTLYYGEYMILPQPVPVAIWKSSDEGQTWQKAHEFPPGTIRHIHAVQYDELHGGIWIGTGDRDEESRVGVSHDGAASFEWAVEGSQHCRACALVFFDDAVVWGMDADYAQNHVISCARETPAPAVGAKLPDTTYYARRVDEERALLGLSRRNAEVWVAHRSGMAQRWLGWTVPERRRPGPVPVVRLARGSGGEFVHLNPLRTVEHEATIFRIAVAALVRTGLRKTRRLTSLLLILPVQLSVAALSYGSPVEPTLAMIL
jgi:hypothetical protein